MLVRTTIRWSWNLRTNYWWLGTCFIVPYIGNNDPNWLSYFSEGLAPPTRLGRIDDWKLGIPWKNLLLMSRIPTVSWLVQFRTTCHLCRGFRPVNHPVETEQRNSEALHGIPMIKMELLIINHGISPRDLETDNLLIINYWNCWLKMNKDIIINSFIILIQWFIILSQLNKMIKLLTAAWDRMVIPYNLLCCFELSPLVLLLNVVFVLLIFCFWKL